MFMSRAIADGLRLQGVDVLTAQDDGTAELDDAELLDRSTELKRVLVTQDEDFVKEASRRQRAGETFFGIVYSHQGYITIGEWITDLKASKPHEWSGRVEVLPL